MSTIEGHTTSLDLWWSEIWDRLGEGARMLPPRDPSHSTAFRQPVAATISNGEPSVRTVVLRFADLGQRLIRFYTDMRAPKVEQLRENPAIALLFYDPVWRLQIRARATARVHHQDDIAWTIWRNTHLLGRQLYSSKLAPGTPVDDPSNGQLEERELSAAESDAGWQNFAVVACEVHHLEAMGLAIEGQRQAAWEWDGQKWQGHWLAP